MKRDGGDLRLAATDLAIFAECAHATALDVREIDFAFARPYNADPSTKLLRERGAKHEQAYRAILEARGRDVHAIPSGSSDAVARTTDAMRRGVDVLYQASFAHGRWIGRTDFVLRVERPSALGPWSYEVADTKLSRVAKPWALLQLCAYSDLLARVQEATPAAMHIVLGDMREESFATARFAAYFRYLRARHERALEAPASTYPEPVDHCTVCDWFRICDAQWRNDDHLSLVAGLSTPQRRALEMHGIATVRMLAQAPLAKRSPIAAIGPPAFARIREQARIQIEGRDTKRTIHELLEPIEEGRGLCRLPPPSPSDLFLDFEGDPYAERDGLEYLVGFAERGDDGTPRYTALWSFDRGDERRAFEQVMARIGELRARDPSMHVYHYGDYEATALKKLAGRHASQVDALDDLLRREALVDLYKVVRQSLRASVESYSLKRIEPLYAFTRSVPLRDANACLAAFETWLELRSPDAPHDEMRAGIAGYNRDDCLSTWALRDWLEAQRSDLEARKGTPLPRPALVKSTPSEALSEKVERVRSVMRTLLNGVPDDEAARSPDERARFIAAHLLEWHRREDKSAHWEYYRLCDLPEDELIEDRTAISGLAYEGIIRQEARSLVHRYAFPAQSHAIDRALEVHDPRTKAGAGTLVAIDETAKSLDLKRVRTSTVPHPTALVPRDIVSTDEQRASLLRLGEHLAHTAATNVKEGAHAASAALLLRSPPRSSDATASPHEPSVQATAIARALDVRGSVLPIQGPPGTGKTHLAARMITALVRAGKRVGVMANSHKVITNLLDATCHAADESRTPLRAVQKSNDGDGSSHPSVTAAETNRDVRDALASGRAHVAAGTSWLWAREEMIASVDVLFIDEAGQLALANALASAPAANGLVLLGDPQQLDQPQKGVHPDGTSVSALGHVLGGNATLSADRGLFLDETWRMHPDVCRFISEVFYEGRLRTRPELARLRLDAPQGVGGTGLRFVPVPHRGNQSESPEEARAVARLIATLLHDESTWTDRHGVVRPLTANDVLVVAPYNAHVARLVAQVPAGVRVGTVDKFQGQEAPIAIYTMATSSPEDAPRGTSFLYSGNRFNVAISRARCASFLVASPALFEMRSRSTAEMILANAFCRYLEEAREIAIPQ